MSKPTAPKRRPIANFPPINRMLTAAEHPFPLGQRTLRYDTMYVETGRYLRQMIARHSARRRQDRGSQIRDARRHRSLAGKPRFQLHRPRQPRPVQRSGAAARRAASSPSSSRSRRSATRCTGGPGYMFPRADGIILGGTFERDQWDTTPDPAAIAGSSRAISASSTASAAPLEQRRRAPDIAVEMNYHTLHSPERRGASPKC